MGALNIRPIPDNLHRALRIEAATRGTSIRALVIELLEESLARQPKSPAPLPRAAGGRRRRARGTR